MRRLTLATVLALGVALTALPGAAGPKPKPKPVVQTVPFRDATPDPTGVLVGTDGHCSGLQPREAPYKYSAPAAGTLTVSLGGFQGEWALHVSDASGRLLAETDVPPPDYESVILKLRKGQVLQVLPCNLAGTPDSVITLKFVFS